MTRGVQWSLVCFVVFVALLALAGCSHYLFAEREPWRHDAEIACINSGAVKDSPQRVRISSISGPGICGIDYTIRIAAIGMWHRMPIATSRRGRPAQFPAAQ